MRLEYCPLWGKKQGFNPLGVCPLGFCPVTGIYMYLLILA